MKVLVLYKNEVDSKEIGVVPCLAISDFSKQDREKLESALIRYKCLIGLLTPTTPYEKELFSVDRKNLSRYQIPLKNVGPGVDTPMCPLQASKFLNEITGCDLDVCELYIFMH